MPANANQRELGLNPSESVNLERTGLKPERECKSVGNWA